jgi:hypothetical protein
MNAHDDDDDHPLADWMVKQERRSTDLYLRVEALRVLLEARGLVSAAEFAAALDAVATAAVAQHQQETYRAVQDASLAAQDQRLRAALGPLPPGPGALPPAPPDPPRS